MFQNKIFCKNSYSNVAGIFLTRLHNDYYVLLLLNRRGYWVTPGGQVDYDDLSNEYPCLSTLAREFNEETSFPMPEIEIINRYVYNINTLIFIVTFSIYDLGDFGMNNEMIDMNLFSLSDIVRNKFDFPPLARYVKNSFIEIYNSGMLDDFINFNYYIKFPSRLYALYLIPNLDNFKGDPRFDFLIYGNPKWSFVHITVCGFYDLNPLYAISILEKLYYSTLSNARWNISTDLLQLVKRYDSYVVNFASQTLNKLSEYLSLENIKFLKGPLYSHEPWHITFRTQLPPDYAYIISSLTWNLAVVELKDNVVTEIASRNFHRLK
jgi:NTP pyrophosphohydrolases including oxidative damage repair enzymes